MNKTLMLAVTGGVMLVVLGIILTIGTQLTTKTKENTADRDTTDILNEIIASSSAGGELSCDGDVDSPASISISGVGNVSGTNQTYNSGNWSVDSVSGYINFTTTSNVADNSGYEQTGNVFAVNYSCFTYGLGWGVGIDSTQALTDLAGWNTTLAVVIAAVVIVGLLMAGFGAFLYFKND